MKYSFSRLENFKIIIGQSGRNFGGFFGQHVEFFNHLNISVNFVKVSINMNEKFIFIDILLINNLNLKPTFH